MSILLPPTNQNVPIVTMLRYLFFILFILPVTAWPGVNPKIDWKMISTPHFEVIFDAKQQQIALQYASYAETSFSLLVPVFKEYPQKTVIVIDDSFDQANGSATRLPYPTIVVRPVLPEMSDSIGAYGNWGYELVLHEYTHILTFEPAHGVAKPLRYIFGSILSPNLLLPRWYLEGLAVKMETDFSDWGRLRSNSQQAAVRSLVIDKKLAQEDIARANEVSITDYPFGARPYLLGSMFWQKFFEEKGYSGIYDLTQRYSSRVPFLFLETPAKEIIGSSYQKYLNKVIAEYQIKASEQIRTIDKSGTLQGKEINTAGLVSSHLSPSPDGKKLAYITRGHNWNSEIIISSKNKTEADLTTGKDRVNNISRLSWHPNSKKILYDKVGSDTDRYNIYYDIYERDLADIKTEKRITNGLRAHQPSYSLDGQKIVFIQNETGSHSLNIIEVNGQNKKTLYLPPIQHRLSHPEFISDQEIIFSERNISGDEGLIVLNISKNTYRRVLNEFMPAYRPEFTTKGLVFISEKNGVPNAYLANTDLTRAHAITNSKTAISRAEIDSAGSKIFFTELTGRGPQIFVSEYSDKIKFNLNKIENTHAIQKPKDFVESTVDANLKSQQKDFSIQEYASYPYLLPHYWIPFVYPLQGGVLLQAITSGADPLSKHSYSGLFSYNTLASSSGLFLNYLNQTMTIPIVASASKYEDFLLGSTTPRKNLSAFLGIQSYIYNLPKAWQLLTGWVYSQKDISTREVFRSGPKINFTYNTASQKGDEISPESGQSASVSYTHYYAEPATFNRLNYEEYALDYSTYFSSWLPARHTLYFHLKGYWANFNSTAVAGATSSGAAYQSTLITGEFLMRGFPSGAFLGNHIGSLNLEYRFPINKINRGAGTTPFFARRMHGRFFVDSIILDGFFYDIKRESYMFTNSQKGYSGVGAEIHLDTTSFFYLPLDIYAGLYYGTDENISGGGIVPFVGISL